MDTVFYAIAIIYALLILWFILGFMRMKSVEITNHSPTNKFSIVIPFRNEANNLLDLLNSIIKLDYPSSHFEVILVDDFSSDNFIELLNNFKSNNPKTTIQVLKNSTKKSPKKAAITLGIKHAKFEWMVTTDADCCVPEYWLKAFDYGIQNSNSKMLCGPVQLQSKPSLSALFEILNFNSLQGATIGSFGWKRPILCNGANLSYSKQAFLDVDGFEGNEQIASGDDIFLLEKFKHQFPKSIQFLKSESAIVVTKTQSSLSDFIAQQQRWAAKSKSYKSTLAKLVGAVVFIQNLSLVTLFFLAISQAIYWELFFNCLAIKMIVDTVLIYQSLRFYKQEKLTIASLPMSLVYPLFSVATVLLSMFSKYQWKGRAFKS